MYVCGEGVTFPDPAPKNTLIRLVARFFQLSGPAPTPDSGTPGATLGSDPPSMDNVPGDGMLASPRNSVMFFRRRAWPCVYERERKSLQDIGGNFVEPPHLELLRDNKTTSLCEGQIRNVLSVTAHYSKDWMSECERGELRCINRSIEIWKRERVRGRQTRS